MNEMLQEALFFGVAVSLIGYEIGLFLKKKCGLAIFNPLLIAIIFVMIVLSVCHIDYDVYYAGAKYISYLLTPATVCLAIPLYEQLSLLKKNAKAIFAGIFSGVVTSLVSVLGLSVLFRLEHAEYVTLLPKSITTAIGMDVSKELGGIVAITTAVIIVTGILGNMIAAIVFRLFRIEEPIARGVALGTSAHAIGTVRALEFGELEGAVSGLAIAVAGLITVVGASFFAGLY